MACGEKYADLLVVRGNGPDDPCGGLFEEWSCNALDSQAYNQRADEIMALNTAAWNALVEAGWTTNQNPGLFEQANAYWTAHENMMRWSITGPLLDPDANALIYNSQIVQSSLSVMQLGVCVLERLNGEIEALIGENKGVEPPDLPGEETIFDPKGKGEDNDLTSALKWIAVGVAVFAGIAIWDRLSKR